MRIFGGNDYYDGAIAQLYASGYDPKIIFHRYENLILEDEKAKRLKIPSLVKHLKTITYDSLSYRDGKFRKERLVVNTGRLIFCGKLYNFLQVVEGDRYSFVWSRKEAEPLLKEIKYFNRPNFRWLASSKKSRKLFDISTFFDPMDIPNPEKFMDERITIVLLYPWPKRRETTLGYPYSKYEPLVNYYHLEGIQFYKKLDAWTAAQEISMWVGNLGSPERNIVELDNDTRAAKHGMDKTSFRRDTHASKPRKQKKRRKKKK